MKRISTPKRFLLFMFLLNLISLHSSAQEFVYVSPKPGSRMVQSGQAISLRTSNEIDSSSLSSALFVVRGTASGTILGQVSLLSDNKTIVFRPFADFTPGESVQVSVAEGIRQKNQTVLSGFSFGFQISQHADEHSLNTFEINYLREGIPVANTDIIHPETKEFIGNRSGVPLPDDFPPLCITADSNPAPGYYFLFSNAQNPERLSYMMILDRSGVPVFYRGQSNRGNDFKVQPNGYVTYFDFITTRWTEIDSSYQFRRYYMADNGYTADAHELIVKEDGSYWLLIYDAQPVDMSQIVEGGNPNAIVVGLVVQHCDASGNALFQWRSWDHMEITDCDTSWVDLTASLIDYVHGNAISFDDMGNVLISSRKLHEITKIDYNTGNIIWRWGGSQNMFQLIGDDRWFSAQHSIEYQGNNIYTMFDNGFRLEPEYSRGLVYELNEVGMTATLITTYENDPPVFAWAMGHMQMLPNDHVVLGWATNPDNYVLTEYHPDGTKAFEIVSEDMNMISYRAFKFPWKHTYFDVSDDSLNFGEVDIETGQSVIELIVRNLKSETLSINSVSISDDVFVLLDELPVSIPGNGEKVLSFGFQPIEEKDYASTVYLGTYSSTEYIGVSVFFEGKGLLTGLAEKSADSDFVLYPNPVESGRQLKIQSADGVLINSISFCDITGRILMQFDSPHDNPASINIPHLQPGIYIVQVHSGEGVTCQLVSIY